MASTTDLVGGSTTDLPKKPQEKTFRTMTMTERITYVKQVITVEPIIAAYLMSSLICSTALVNLQYEKGCSANLGFNDTVCQTILYQDVNNFTQETIQITALIADMQSWQLPLQSVMPLILILFLGSYSDRHRLRKPFLLIPIFGEFFAVAGCILCVVFMKEWSLEVEGVLQTVVPSFFGGQSMLVMAVFSYIADVSTVEMRTLRVGVVQIVLNVCSPIAQGLSAVVFENLGYIGALSIAVCLYLFALLYGIFRIKEPKQPDVVSGKSFFVDAFDPTHAIDTFNLLLKKSPGNNRLFILVVLVILFVYSVVLIGEGSVFFFYAKNVFSWTAVENSYFSTTNTVVHLVGVLVGVPLLSNYLHMGDLMILVLTFVDKIVANLIFGVANSTLWLYVAAVVSIITGISTIAIRSMATKTVSKDDLGKAQSLFGICEALGPIVGAPLYNSVIIVNTLNTFISAFFYVGVILYGLCILVIISMYFKEKRIREQEIPPTAPKITMKDYQTTHM